MSSNIGFTNVIVPTNGLPLSPIKIRVSISTSDFDNWLKTLEPSTQAIYKSAWEYSLYAEDTLSDDFQLCASIAELFHKKYARED